MALKSKLLLISRGREDSRAHRLAVAIVEYAWDRGAEVRVRHEAGSWPHAWAAGPAEESAPEVTVEDLKWADVTIVLADRQDARIFRGMNDRTQATSPRLVS